MSSRMKCACGSNLVCSDSVSMFLGEINRDLSEIEMKRYEFERQIMSTHPELGSELITLHERQLALQSRIFHHSTRAESQSQMACTVRM